MQGAWLLWIYFVTLLLCLWKATTPSAPKQMSLPEIALAVKPTQMTLKADMIREVKLSAKAPSASSFCSEITL